MTIEHALPAVAAAAADESALAWLDEAGPLLEDSRWAPALDVAGIRVWDALLNPLNQELLSLARDGGAGGAAASTKLRDLARRWCPWPVRDWVSRRRSEELAGFSLGQQPEAAPVVLWPR